MLGREWMEGGRTNLGNLEAWSDTISSSSTIFLCSQFRSTLISRSAVTGKPFRSAGSILSFFSAITLPVSTSLARDTYPYVPSSMSFSFSYLPTARHGLHPPDRSFSSSLSATPSVSRSGVSFRLLLGLFPSSSASSCCCSRASSAALRSSSRSRAFSAFWRFFSSFWRLSFASRAASSSVSAQREEPGLLAILVG